MNIHFRRVPSGMVLLSLFLIYSGCSTYKKSDESLDSLYSQASSYSSHGDYIKAIICYNKALALDTLNTASPRFVKALNEKRVFEGLTGEYYAALKSSARLEKFPVALLTDSLRHSLYTDKAVWLRELGSFGEAAEALKHIVRPTLAERFELASLYRQSGDYQKAAEIYRRLSGFDSDPVTRITGYAGQLQCKVAQPRLGIEKADVIARKIAAESGRVLAMKGSLVERIQALRAASQSLQLLEKHRRNASFFLFKALILAEESRNPLLLQILRLESNSIIVRKSEPFREAAEYFRLKNLQYAQASSLFMLAGSKSLSNDERIAALQQGFSVNRYYAPPYPANEQLQLEKISSRRLTGLLLEKSRIFELFDVEEQVGNLDLQRSLQIYRKSFRLGKGHDALEAEISKLLHEASALLQRKADIIIRAEGYEKNRLADQSLNIKRGRLIELVPEVRVINPVAAEAIQMIPVTLSTVQTALKEDQAIIKPLISDSLCGVMLIGKRQLQIAGGGACFDSLNTPASKIEALRRELASSNPGRQQSKAQQEWFSKTFYEPLAKSLGSYKRLVVICDDLFPYHILSSFNNSSLPVKQYSYLQSIKEFALLSEHPAPDAAVSNIIFYQADNVGGARLQKLLFPRDRVFLLWKNYSGKELQVLHQQIGQEMLGTVSGSGALTSLASKSGIHEIWMNISPYGTD